MTALIVGIEAPGVRLSVFRDDDVVIRASGNVSAGRDGDFGGDEQDTRLAAVDDDFGLVFDGELAEVDSALSSVDTAPNVHFAGLAETDGVMRTALDLDHVEARERADFLGNDDRVAFLAGAVGDTSLCEVVRAPSPGFTGIVDGEGVIDGRVDGDSLLLGKSNVRREQREIAMTLDHATADL